MNHVIIEQFTKLVRQVEAEYLNAQVEDDPKEIVKHKFRLQSIKKVLSVLRVLDFEITEPADLDNIPGVGEKSKLRIREILDTGQLSELKSKYDKKKQAKIDSIQELEGVINIGSKIARKLVTQYNIKSIDELKKAIKTGKIKVNDKILLGLKYYGVVEGNIPRKEVAAVEKYLIRSAYEIDPSLEIMICGSYRRGKKTSGDIDLLLYHPDAKTMKQTMHPIKFGLPRQGLSPASGRLSWQGLQSYLEVFVDKLSDEKFLLDDMTDKNYNIKYMGFCKYKNNPVRRIDMRYMPYNSLPTAMLYFTGPYELNKIMREAAKKRGMLLNEYGLYYLDDVGARLPIKIKSEADVFKQLGMNYMTPEQRENLSTGKIKKTKQEA